jgi:hypothetical protein
MSFGKASIAVAVALTMSSAPVIAQTSTSAAALSVAAQSDRSGASLESENQMFGGTGGFIIPLLAIAAIILGILAATSGGGDDLPTSP